tara:strand:- start:8452 stop:9108 length:657 start_codon:yes stop_codon:yes gene_type:complete
MAKKTLRKGDNHKKKTRSKRRGGMLDFFQRKQRMRENEAEKNAMHKKDQKKIEEGRRKRLVKDRIEDMKMFPEKYYVEKPNDIDNNPSIKGSELIKLLRKQKSELTTEEQNIIDYGNFYIYLTYFQESTDTTINIKLILGKATGPITRMDTVQFRNEMDHVQDFYIERVNSFYYTIDKPDEKSNEEPDEKSNEEQPGGNRKKKTRSKRTKRGSKRATK